MATSTGPSGGVTGGVGAASGMGGGRATGCDPGRGIDCMMDVNGCRRAVGTHPAIPGRLMHTVKINGDVR